MASPEQRDIDWGSAEIDDAALTVELTGASSKAWKQRFQGVLALLETQHSRWGEVQLNRSGIQVADVQPGTETSTNRSAPREAFAEPFLARMCHASPVHAKLILVIPDTSQLQRLASIVGLRNVIADPPHALSSSGRGRQAANVKLYATARSRLGVTPLSEPRCCSPARRSSRGRGGSRGRRCLWPAPEACR
jgi:hypothetical protein